ncbi:hypothetical protein AAHH71_26290 [Bacillus toyonensis]
MMRSAKYRRNQFRIGNDSLGFDLQHTLGVAGQNCEITVIIESGLYSLLFYMQPKKGVSQNESLAIEREQKLKKFKKWVTSEVRLSIRKHGAYMTEDILEKALTSPDFLIKLATNLKHEQEARKLAESQVVKQQQNTGGSI